MPQKLVAQTFADSQKKLGNFIKKRVAIVEDAEDILQEVFYQFARVSEIGEPIEQPVAWLYRVVRNLIINRYKKKQENFLDEMSDVFFVRKRRRKQNICVVLFLTKFKVRYMNCHRNSARCLN
jgi:DNA-directed RNA polymerase specialized sigma24 family protein